jgi:hypothetical protein
MVRRRPTRSAAVRVVVYPRSRYDSENSADRLILPSAGALWAPWIPPHRAAELVS